MAEALHTRTLRSGTKKELNMNFLGERKYAFENLVSSFSFVVLAFSYLFFYQDGLLYALFRQHFGAGITYSRTLGAIVITAFFLLLHVVLRRLYIPKWRSSAISFVPEIALLAGLTNFKLTAKNTLSYDEIAVFCILIALLFVFTMIFFRARNKAHERTTDTQPLFKTAWKNIFIISFLFAIMCSIADSDKLSRMQIRIEQRLEQNDYTGALSIMKTSNRHNENIAMLTMYALSCEGELTEKLFEYPVCSSSKYVLPQNGGTKTLFYPTERIFSHLGMATSSMKSGKNEPHSIFNANNDDKTLASKNAHFIDYLLCSYLLDRNIEQFVKTFIAHKKSFLKVPKHYQEALILYTHTRSNPQMVYQNDVVETDYKDFQRMEKDAEKDPKRIQRLHDVYGNTYWFYYFRPA